MPDTYQMFNPKKKRVVLSRVICWLNTFKLNNNIERFSLIEDFEINSDEDDDNNNIYQNLDSAFCVQDVLDEEEHEISTESMDYGKVEITYQEAINGPDKEQWKKAIKEEVKKWRQHEVYETNKIKDVPQNKRL